MHLTCTSTWRVSFIEHFCFVFTRCICHYPETDVWIVNPPPPPPSNCNKLVACTRINLNSVCPSVRPSVCLSGSLSVCLSHKHTHADMHAWIYAYALSIDRLTDWLNNKLMSTQHGTYLYTRIYFSGEMAMQRFAENAQLWGINCPTRKRRWQVNRHDTRWWLRQTVLLCYNSIGRQLQNSDDDDDNL